MYTKLQYDDETPPSITIVEGISSLEGVDATETDELGFTLHEYVDPEALDRIMAGCSDDDHLVVSFSIDAYRVSIANSGYVRIRTRE